MIMFCINLPFLKPTYNYIEKYEAVNFALRDKGPNLYRIDVNSIKTY